MTLNNWLCHHFDTEKKGYVTIKDFVIEFLFWAIIGLFLFGGYVYGIINFYRYGLSLPDELNLIYISELTTLAGSLSLFLFVLYELLKRIACIKIAKCELKEDMK